MHSTQNWFGISKRRPRRDWGMEGGRPEWTEKLRAREEEQRDSEGKNRERGGDTERKARETKKKKKKKNPREK